VANGRLSGQTLAELCPDFPLLIKVLSCEADLSVQVHPPDHYPRLRAGESGKSEVWLVLEAAPGSSIIHGLAEGVTPEALTRALADASTTVSTTLKAETAKSGAADIMDCFRRVSVAAGDLIPVPPGTVHALGAGLVVAEVQQSSDTTYRLWDYGRLGIDGKLRGLHVEQALKVASYSRPPAITRPFAFELKANNPQRMCSFANFDIWRSTCSGRWHRSASPGTFRAILALSGHGTLQWDDDRNPGNPRQRIALRPGSSVLIPAACPDYTIQCDRGRLGLLEVTPA
jgi:mannose-6-phosphate isomerase